MTERTTERPDLPMDDRDEPVPGGGFPPEPGSEPRQDLPADIPGPEDDKHVASILAKDVDALRRGGRAET
jgi:hypothetical protein